MVDITRNSKPRNQWPEIKDKSSKKFLIASKSRHLNLPGPPGGPGIPAGPRGPGGPGGPEGPRITAFRDTS